jgi:hypothetical protein
MTTPTKVVLYGELTTFSIGGTAVGQVISIDGIGASKAKVSTTVLGDTVKQNRLSSLTDVKDVKLTVLYSPTAHGTALRGWLETADPASPSTVAIAVFAAGGTTASETYSNTGAYPTDWSLSNVKEDGNIELEVTIASNAKWTV